ncbi:hypothetical protein PIB30_001165 [Stylosanthes scabra]|uniref:Uncharacterized protein n=1 Tax=Stylosanthes scabra TaxID=79078 RepID=A0ABU6V1R0_9FABA|nr:hypothetical protein [Stylosanthes scabra]
MLNQMETGWSDRARTRPVSRNSPRKKLRKGEGKLFGSLPSPSLPRSVEPHPYTTFTLISHNSQTLAPPPYHPNLHRVILSATPAPSLNSHWPPSLLAILNLCIEFEGKSSLRRIYIVAASSVVNNQKMTL